MTFFKFFSRAINFWYIFYFWHICYLIKPSLGPSAYLFFSLPFLYFSFYIPTLSPDSSGLRGSLSGSLFCLLYSEFCILNFYRLNPYKSNPFTRLLIIIKIYPPLADLPAFSESILTFFPIRYMLYAGFLHATTVANSSRSVAAGKIYCIQPHYCYNSANIELFRVFFYPPQAE